MHTHRWCNTALILVFLLSLSASPLPGAEIDGIKKLPLTLYEVEQVVTRWLKQSGFQVQKFQPTQHRTSLSAAKDDVSYRIDLIPFSPLATQVRVESMETEIAGGDFQAQLLKHLSNYLDSAGETPVVGTHAIPTEILSRIDAVVCVEITSEEGSRQVSGFIIEETEGLVMCTAHDLKQYQHITIIRYDGLQLPGQIVYLDPGMDLTLIRVDASVRTFIPLTESRNLLSMGEKIYAVGCPSNLRGTVTPGIVNSPPRRADGLPLWQVDMKILPGSSGSPVFNAQGVLVGVVKGRHREVDSVGFLIPVETIIAFVNQKPLS